MGFVTDALNRVPSAEPDAVAPSVWSVQYGSLIKPTKENSFHLSNVAEQDFTSTGQFELSQEFPFASLNHNTERRDDYDASCFDWLFCESPFSSRHDTASKSPKPEIWFNGVQIDCASGPSNDNGPALDCRVNHSESSLKRFSHGSDIRQAFSGYDFRQTASGGHSEVFSGTVTLNDASAIAPMQPDSFVAQTIVQYESLSPRARNGSPRDDTGSGGSANAASELLATELRSVVEELYIQQGHTLSHVMQTLRARNFDIPS